MNLRSIFKLAALLLICTSGDSKPSSEKSEELLPFVSSLTIDTIGTFEEEFLFAKEFWCITIRY